MNGLPPHIQQAILELKAKRGILESENVEPSRIINSSGGVKGSNTQRIKELGEAIFVLEREGKYPQPEQVPAQLMSQP